MILEEKLHRIYCEETGLQIRLQFGRDRAWTDFVRCGFTEEDLRLVIGYLRKGIAKSERNAGCLKFHNLIQQTDMFEEDLALAKKALNQRQRPAQGPQQAVRVQTGGGGFINRLDDPPELSEEEKRIKASVAEQMREFRATMRRG